MLSPCIGDKSMNYEFLVRRPIESIYMYMYSTLLSRPVGLYHLCATRIFIMLPLE